jgi:hypothetical protein
MKRERRVVAFRLDASHLKGLEKDASGYKLSHHKHARKLVMEALDDTATERLEKRLIMLEAEVSELRSDLATAVEALLIVAGNYPKEKAKEWVDRNLRAQ